MSTHTATNNKPLEEWSKDQVQKWLIEGKYKEYAASFPINSAQLAGLEERHFIAALGLIVGACLFNDVQRLKAPQPAGTRRAHILYTTTSPLFFPCTQTSPPLSTWGTIQSNFQDLAQGRHYSTSSQPLSVRGSLRFQLTISLL